MSEKVKKKIKALLTKAESTEFQEEADAFFAKAAELMAQHAVSEDEIRQYKDEKSIPKPERRSYVVASPYSADRMYLVSQVAEALGGYAYYMKQRRDGYKTRNRVKDHNTYAFLVGFPHDLDQIEVMLESLNRQMDIAREKAMAQTYLPGMGGKKVWSATFIRAYSMRIGQRLREAYQTVMAEQTGGVALAIRNKNEIIRAELAGLGVKAQTSQRQFDSNAASAGRAAADRASIYKQVGQ